MWIHLTRRLANWIDGVNLLAHSVGDVFEVPRRDAELLIAEAWAVEVAPRTHPFQSRTTSRSNGTKPGDRQRTSIAKQLRHVRQQIQRRSFESCDRRRAEDRIRDEWHDEHATVINNDDRSS